MHAKERTFKHLPVWVSPRVIVPNLNALQCTQREGYAEHEHINTSSLKHRLVSIRQVVCLALSFLELNDRPYLSEKIVSYFVSLKALNVRLTSSI